MALARRVWWELEPINAVTYFAAECRQAAKDIGLRGFWMGYFACRAAPLGRVSPAVVESTFFNFHPDMVRRAVPDAWTFADPDTILSARSSSAAEAIVRLAPEANTLWSRGLPMLVAAIGRGCAAGRPLFTANRDVLSEMDGVAAMWQAATTLREHRGDGHVAVLTERALDGCEAHVLFAATEGVPPELLRSGRGWSEDDWDEAVDRLRTRGLVDVAGEPTTAAHELRRAIEQRTDELAAQPYETLGGHDIAVLLSTLRRVARPVAGSGEIPFPNPMGLPRPSPGR